ncbi:MAG: Ig-like domain-containing protein [Acidobacteriota bacterium]
MNRLTLSPSYLISNGTNHYGAAGTAVYFAHTLTNAGPQADTFDFYAAGYAPVSSAGYTVTIYSDPNGDGNPADGTVITHTPPVTANGGVFHFVVEIDVPAAVAPPATDSTQITAVRCTDSSCSGSDTSVAASVTDETKVAYIIPFQDSLYSIQGSLFAPCSTVYPEGVNLVPDQYNRYELVYKTPSGATAATRVLQDDNTGTLRDSFTFPATAAQGKWTITLMDTITSPATQLDSATVTLERNTSISAVPAPLGHPASGAPLVAAVSLVNGNSGAPLTNTRVNYLVLDPSGTEYLQSTGTFTTYTGGLTASHGTFDVAQQTSGADTLSIPSVTYPSYGIYTLCAIWEAECGSDNNPADDLASQCLNIYVVTWASYSDSGHTAPSSSFEVPAAVYLDGAGFGASMPYVEAVYGPGGTLITTKALTSGSNQHLSDSLASTTLAGIGTYHAVVYPPSATPPAVYTPSDPHIIAETAFGVTLSPPALQGPASAGDTRVSGTSTKPAGTPVTLYLNGTAVGTGTVQSGGGFTITSDTPFSQGNVLTAKQTVSGVQSSPSNSLTVAADTFAFSTPATNTLLNRVADRNLQAPGYQTYISGTGKPGASVTVTDGAGNLLGNAVVQSDGTWAVTVTLTVGNSYSFTVTQSDAAGNTRTATHTGISFDPRPNLLRSDAISTLAPTTPTLSSILTTHSPSLLIWGPNGVADRGEGALLNGNGSSDDDDFYIASIDSGLLDPDVPVASDTNRPLVFYQLDTPGNTLRLTKVKDSSGNIRIKISY